MSTAELAVVNQMLRATPRGGPIDWLQQRQSLEAMTAMIPLPEGVSRVEVTAGGVPAEWLHVPDAAQDRALLYLHGGGYCVGSLKTHRGLASHIARSLAGRVLAIDYRLAPEQPYPAALDDAVAAYRFLLDQGIKPSRIAIAGDSAGGGLTLAMLLAARAQNLPQPAAAWLLSPWGDLELRGAAIKTNAERDLIIFAEHLHEFAKAYAGARRAEPLVSPVHANLAGLPPLLIQVSSAEALLDDSLTLARNAGAADVDVRLEIWPHMPHVWHALAPILSEARDAIIGATTWLNARLGAATTGQP